MNFCLCFPQVLSDLHEIRYKRPVHNAIQHSLSSVKAVAGKCLLH